MGEKTWLYSEQEPNGRIFDNEEADIPFMIANGWYDTPAALPSRQPVVSKTGKAKEAAKEPQEPPAE